MPRITFVQPDGTRSEVEAEPGASIMHTAQERDVDGIVAECGGSLMCATCHVYVAEEDLSRLPPMSPNEDMMLDGTASERRANSRLSCQITVTEALDGLTVHLPPEQI